MPDHPHELEAATGRLLGGERVLVCVLEQPPERCRLLADLGEELRAGYRRLVRRGDRAHCLGFRGRKTGAAVDRSRRLSSVTSR